MALLDQVLPLPGARETLAAARAELPQKDDLCGALTGLVALRAHGVAVADQDEVARVAGTVLPSGAPFSGPPGERRRTDYRLELPSTSDPGAAGTSAEGVVRAVDVLSDGALVAVPASGRWDTATLGAVLAGCGGLSRVAAIGNVDTGCFAAHDTPDRALRDYLDDGIPPLWTSRWRAGHFVLLAGVLPGTAGTLVSVVDTYPSLGRNGVHLQPLGHVAAALRREGTAPGGMLLVVRAAERDRAVGVVTDAGLRPELWDNGSPAP